MRHVSIFLSTMAFVLANFSSNVMSNPVGGETSVSATSALDYVDEYGINHGKGITIDGVTWAPVNCGYHKTDHPWGKLYQWGRKQGQEYGKATIVPGPAPSLAAGQSAANADKFYKSSNKSTYNWTKNNMSLWNSANDFDPVKVAANDPCPKGWRVSSFEELRWLMENRSKWTKNEAGQSGYWFSGMKPYLSASAKVFFPAAGMLFWGTGEATMRDKYGFYWCSKHGGSDYGAFKMEFDNEKVKSPTDKYANYGLSVRCVQE